MTKLMSLATTKSLIAYGTDVEADYCLLRGWLLNSSASEPEFKSALTDCVNKATLLVKAQEPALIAMYNRYAHAVVALTVADNFIDRAGPSRKSSYLFHRDAALEKIETALSRFELSADLRSKLDHFEKLEALKLNISYELESCSRIMQSLKSASEDYISEKLNFLNTVSCLVELQKFEFLVLNKKTLEASKACEFAADVVRDSSEFLDRVTFNLSFKKLRQ